MLVVLSIIPRIRYTDLISYTRKIIARQKSLKKIFHKIQKFIKQTAKPLFTSALAQVCSMVKYL